MKETQTKESFFRRVFFLQLKQALLRNMQLTFFFSVIILLHSVTFSFQVNGWKKISFNHGLHMTDQSNIHDTTLDGKLHIQTRDMKLTETLESRVKNKVGKVLEKLGKDILSVNVVLRIHRFPLQGRNVI